MEALLRYFNAERGSRARLAAEIGITPGAVSQWERVPVERLLEIERVTGIPRSELRPDLYPADPSPAPAPARSEEAA